MFEVHQVRGRGDDDIGFFARAERVCEPRGVGVAAEIVPHAAHDPRRRSDVARVCRLPGW